MTNASITPEWRDAVRVQAHPLRGQPTDYDELLRLIGDARIVMLGDATHGTHEFYEERIRLTEKLIVECGFTALAIESGALEAWRINRYIHGVGDADTSREALSDCKEFPQWLWRNAAMSDFLVWLYAFNSSEPHPSRQISVYGLDPFSFFSSTAALIRFLAHEDPRAAERARRYFAQFEQFALPEEPAPALNLSPQLLEVLLAYLDALHTYRASQTYQRYDGRMASDEAFLADIENHANAQVNDYYRLLLTGHTDAWNQRERAMFQTLQRIDTHLLRRTPHVRTIVWGHNAHVGDMRATALSQHGVRSLGQLVRDRYGADAVLIGYCTHHGTVTTANAWDDTPNSLTLPPAKEGSYEEVFHATGIPNFWLALRRNPRLRALDDTAHLERFSGAVSTTDATQDTRYLESQLGAQFDAIIHLDETHAIEPLEANG